MDRRTFEQIRALVYERSGIALRPGKEAMVRARLAKRMRALGMSTHTQYLRHVCEDASGEEITQLLNAISTNVTTFFREADHFDFLGQAIAEWLGGGQKRFRLWSTACSSGEEPYTMAMTMLEATRGYAVDAKILATDISTRVLETASEGQYNIERMEPVPRLLRARYFEHHGRGESSTWSVLPALRETIVFKRLNLSQPPFPLKGPLDAVFCRNVMIYFDNAGRQRLLDEVFRLLREGGYLFVGHAESLTGISTRFKPVRSSVYVKP